MAIYALSDLHLSLSEPSKSMEMFGPRWKDYMKRTEENCRSVLTGQDTLLIPGDLSWVLRLSDGEEDFRFIDSLPGRKIIGRGNHDYYWTTVAKLRKALDGWGFNSIEVIRNNCIRAEDSLITGTRGWMLPWDDSFTSEDRKILEREKIRLGLCIDALRAEDPDHELRHILMLHYPPVTTEHAVTEMSEIISGAPVDLCVYGHLHGRSHKHAVNGKVNGDPCLYQCVSADYLDFTPVNLDRL